MKKCTKCSEVKPQDAFYWRKARNAYYSHCKAYRDKGTRALALRKKYGISLEEYERMKAEQNNLCNICGGPEANKELAVDHCHDTGKVRGLLCSYCNTGIGQLRDSPSLLRTTAAYIERYSCV